MQTYTGKVRVRAAFRRECADVVPAYPILGAFTAKMLGLGCSFKQYLTNVGAMTSAILKGYEVLKPDMVIVLTDLLLAVAVFIEVL